MANNDHIVQLMKGAAAWNDWRFDQLDPEKVELGREGYHPGGPWYLVRADLSHADLIGANLEGFNFREGSLSGANLSGANLKNADLGEADLTGTNLSRAILFDARLWKADLTGANLCLARFNRADLCWANLSGANLGRAGLYEANLSGANLSGADLSKADFGRADLSGADLRGVKLNDSASFSAADLRRANLSGADLRGADFRPADLRGANLSKANLSEVSLGYAELDDADLRGANLRGADLSYARLINTDLTDADLTGCRVFGTSAWRLNLERAKQHNLVITEKSWDLRQPDEPEITVDNVGIAQFIYLMLNNQKIRDVIDSITSKAVLILGRFTGERKAVLDALREELRKRDYLPILFDFAVPATRDITETVSLLARMARFIIADLTDPSSIPKELEAIVPNLAVPVQPLIEGSSRPYAMFKDYWRYEWVLPVYRYEGLKPLLATLAEKVIAPAEREAEALAERRRMFEAELTKPQ
jgi:uncharacterized protein YjbI with pentapeptide repeats